MVRRRLEAAGRHPFATVLTAFAALRVLAVAGLDAVRTPDSAGYERVHFAGGATRPWLVPLLYRIVGPDELRVYAQVLLSVAGFSTLALVLAHNVSRSWLRWATVAAVLAVGLTPRVTAWDLAMLSESTAIALTCLLIASFVAASAGASPWWVLAAFLPWTFARDAHIVLGVIVVAVAIVWAVREPGARLVVVSIIAVCAWGLIASQQNDDIEQLNVAGNIAARHDDVSWFARRGMPLTATFEQPAGRDRVILAWRDVELLDWAGSAGTRAYVQYLATNPGFTLEALSAMFTGDGLNRGDTMIDAPKLTWSSRPVLPEPITQTVWPDKGVSLTVPLLVAAAIAVASGWRKAGRRLVVPLILIAASVPHALLVWHGAPFELARHGLVLGLVINVAAFWIVVVWMDTASRPLRVNREPRGSTG